MDDGGIRRLVAAKRDRAEPALEDADRGPDRVGEAASEAAGQAAGSAEHGVSATAPRDGAAEHAVPAAAPRDDAAEHAVPAAAPADDAAARERELQLLSELGVDPHDPELDATIRGLQAGATEELPFGRPGKPLSERSPLRIGFHAALGVMLAAALAYTLVLVAEILVLLVVALFLATGLDPAVESLRRRGLPRSWAVTMVAATFLLGVTGFFVTAVPPLVRQGNALREQAPSYARELRETSDTFRQIDDRLDVVGRLDALNSGDAIIDQGAYRGMLGFARGLLSAVFATLTVLVLTLYFLVSYPGVKRAAYQLVPRSRRARVSLLADEILARIGGYVLGNVATSVVAGIASLAFFGVTGVPYAAALAIFVALTDLIPLVGATIGAIVSIAVAFTVSVPVGIAAIVFFVVYQQFENFVLVPRVMERTVDVSPAVTITAALIGAALFGVVGALLAVPVAAAVQLIGTEVWLPRQENR